MPSPREGLLTIFVKGRCGPKEISWTHVSLVPPSEVLPTPGNTESWSTSRCRTLPFITMVYVLFSITGRYACILAGRAHPLSLFLTQGRQARR